jgi:DNA invertase Pin-like site-specific DNA recombinase
LLSQLAAGDVLTVTRLDRLAEFERDLIRTRTGEGRVISYAPPLADEGPYGT